MARNSPYQSASSVVGRDFSLTTLRLTSIVQRLHQFLKVSVQDRFQFMQTQPYPMIRDAILRVIVGADLFTSLTRPDLGTTMLGNRGFLFFTFGVADAGSEGCAWLFRDS